MISNKNKCCKYKFKLFKYIKVNVEKSDYCKTLIDEKLSKDRKGDGGKRHSAVALMILI